MREGLEMVNWRPKSENGTCPRSQGVLAVVMQTFSELAGASAAPHTGRPKNPPHIMPTYDYECQACGHHFEARQSMKDPHLTDCPLDSCVGPVKRKIGVGAGFIFKGNGFYITDYRSDSYKAAAKKDSESSTSSGSTASTSTATASTSTPSAPAAPAKAASAT
jgi:putative FmdB family regulatory protein